MALLQGHDGTRQIDGGHEEEETNEVIKNRANGGDSSNSSDRGLLPISKLKAMSRLASQKHALSERNRRKRINNHYDSLRQFFPRLLKNDKASVLTETVRRLKELKNMVAGVTPSHDDRSRRTIFIPGEIDEMTVSYIDDGNKKAVRAIICCDDRPDLNQDMTEAIQSVRGKAVKAEMATVGGRTKAEVVVEWTDGGGGNEEDVELFNRALKAVVENRVLGRSRLKLKRLWV